MSDYRCSFAQAVFINDHDHVDYPRLLYMTRIPIPRVTMVGVRARRDIRTASYRECWRHNSNSLNAPRARALARSTARFLYSRGGFVIARRLCNQSHLSVLLYMNDDEGESAGFVSAHPLIRRSIPPTLHRSRY